MATTYVTAGVTTIPAIASAGDNLVFRDGSQTVAGGALSNSVLNWIIPQTFVGIIGGSGTPVTGPVTGYIRNQGGGIFNYSPGSGATCARLINIGQGTVNAGLGTFTKLETAGGTVNIATDCVVPTYVQTGGTATASFYGSGTAGQNDFQYANISGGSLFTERGLDNNASGPKMIVNGGSVRIARINSSTNLPTMTGSATSGILEINGGTVDYQGGNIDTLNGFGGSISFASIQQNITIGTLVCTQKFLNASNFFPAGFTVTVSSATIYAGPDDTV